MHKLSGFEERLAEIGARLVGSPDDTGAVRGAGRSSLISAIPEIDNLWGDIDDLLFAFGRPRSDPAGSVASDRARTVERLLHLTFPSLGTEEHFARLADQLAKNVRLKDVRVIRAEEMSEWVDVLRTAASSRNRVTHYHSRIAATDDDYAFWLPERFPEHRKDTVVRLMILLAEAQSRRRRSIGS